VLQGGFSSVVHSLRAECIEILTEIDARLDFDDELPDLDINLLKQRIEKVWRRVQEALRTEKRGKLLQNGIQVGNITLINIICEYEF
jgi:tRNA modification GTPase